MRLTILTIIPIMIIATSTSAQEISVSVGGEARSVASMGAALDAVASARETNPDAAVTVTITGGPVYVDEPLTLGPAHSGTWDAPVRFVGERDAAGAPAMISGGKRIVDWRVDDGLWVVDWYALAGREVYLSGLFVDGEYRGPAQSPNEGYFHTAGTAPNVTDDDGNEVDRSKLAFQYAEGTIERWPDMDQALILAYHSWDMSHNRIASLDEENRIVTFKQPVNWAFERWGPEQRYVVQHVRSALDAPGEWYLNQDSGMLYYMPKEGESPDTTEVIAPVAASVVHMKGDLANGKFVEHVQFENIVFAHTNYAIAPEGFKDNQAAYPVNGAIQAEGARHVTITNCEVTQTCTYGIWLSTGCQNNRIEFTKVHHLGAGGIRLGHMNGGDGPNEVAGWNTVENCEIYDGGYVFPEGVGVWIGRSSYNRVAHNSIHDFYYTGVSVGWQWGYAETTANHNTFEYNAIHDLGKGVLSDMGGLYHLGVAPGTIVRNNVIHDVESYNYGGWGLYTDEGSTDVLMENNIVYNTKTGGFHQHYGEGNRIQNNIFAFSKNAQIMRTREEDHISFYFERNIVYFDSTELLGSNWSNDNFVMDYNCYYSTANETIDFKGMTFAEWREKGHDRHSIIADPQFATAESYDFTLAADSPALALGFRPIEISLVGPRTTQGTVGISRGHSL